MGLRCWKKNRIYESPLVKTTVAMLVLLPASLGAKILIPMDLTQTDHLKAYGLAYKSLEMGWDVEWLLNYRGGSFLLLDRELLRKEAKIRGVYYELLTTAFEAEMNGVIDENNMDIILLEKAPSVAIYTPPNREPWDDAVTLALTYADIPYETVWDREVLQGKLSSYDWLHLHHEDFTGQFNRFYIHYGQAAWFKEDVEVNTRMASELGFATVADMKAAVSVRIKQYVLDGGFLFAMCSAPETFEIALAAQGVDIVAAEVDGTPIDPNAQSKLDFSKTLAFSHFTLVADASINAFSSIDGHHVNTPGRKPLGFFKLFEFSAKYDPVPTMLTQNHVNYIEDFYGLTTSFTRETLNPAVTVMAFEEGKPWVKYVHGNAGRGTFTYLGGHDPEDKQHAIGDPPTRLEVHKNSPGYRLILNNILFPAARKKELKT
ncbi:MAG: asparagine synthetase B [Candidatus Glassbacteria bacterium]